MPRSDPPHAVEGRSSPRRGGLLALIGVLLSALFMIGRKKTWEPGGVGASLTPAQIVLGAVVGGVVLVAVLVLIVRIAIGLATGA